MKTSPARENKDSLLLEGEGFYGLNSVALPNTLPRRGKRN